MNVSAIIVSKGGTSMKEIVASLPTDWEILIWTNGHRCEILPAHENRVVRKSFEVPDLAVYGRYAAIEYANGDLIYVQDDDCVVDAPIELDSEWMEHAALLRTLGEPWYDHIVCNMPQEFRYDFYSDHALVGFGAVFQRDAFDRAMHRFANSSNEAAAVLAGSRGPAELAWWRRTCDIVFTALTPRVLVDVPVKNLPWANAPDRMWKQPTHREERSRMLDLVLQAEGVTHG